MSNSNETEPRHIAGMTWYKVSEATSTMDIGSAWIKQGMHGCVIQADYQAAGRGRVAGRTWHGKKGENVYASFLFAEEALVSNKVPWSLLVGLAAARCLKKLGVEVGVKWPNDVLARGAGGRQAGGRPTGGRSAEASTQSGGWHKVAGILAQRSGGYLQVGIGINCLQAALDKVCQGHVPFGSIASLGYGAITPDEVLEQLIPEMVAVLCGRPSYPRLAHTTDVASRDIDALRYESLLDQDALGRERLRELQGYLAFLGQEVSFAAGEALDIQDYQAPQGSIRGIFRGINDDGALCIDVIDASGGSTTQAFYAGELIFL